MELKLMIIYRLNDLTENNNLFYEIYDFGEYSTSKLEYALVSTESFLYTLTFLYEELTCYREIEKDDLLVKELSNLIELVGELNRPEAYISL